MIAKRLFWNNQSFYREHGFAFAGILWRENWWLRWIREVKKIIEKKLISNSSIHTNRAKYKYIYIHIYTYIWIHTGCPKRKWPKVVAKIETRPYKTIGSKLVIYFPYQRHPKRYVGPGKQSFRARFNFVQGGDAKTLLVTFFGKTCKCLLQPSLGSHRGAGTPAALRDARRVQGTPRDWVLNLVLRWCWWLLVAIVAQFYLIPSQLSLTYYLPLFQHGGPYLREPRGTSW